MSTTEESKEEVQFSGRAISLYGIWFLSQFLIIVGMLATMTLATLGVLFFYTTFTLAVMVLALYLAFVRDKKEKLKELMSLNVADSIYPFIVIGVGTFLVFYIMHNIMGNQIQVPANWMDIFMMQAIIIVPAETFIFVYFMVNILPEKITVWVSKKAGREIYIPGWMVAQVSFATFHWRVYDLNPFQMFFAFAMGVVFYQMYIGGKTVSFLGLPAVIAFHFVWNVMAILYGGAGTPPGSIMYDPLTLPAVSIIEFVETSRIGIITMIMLGGVLFIGKCKYPLKFGATGRSTGGKIGCDCEKLQRPSLLVRVDSRTQVVIPKDDKREESEHRITYKDEEALRMIDESQTGQRYNPDLLRI